MKKLTLWILLISAIALAGCSLSVRPEENNVTSTGNVLNNNAKPRECLTTTKPWVEIISPNGGETIIITPQPINPDSMEQEPQGNIPVKIKVCNVTSSGWISLWLVTVNNKISGRISFPYPDFLSKQSVPMSVPAVGQYPLPVYIVGQYKALVELIDANAYVVTNTPADSDTSDDSFTIKR